MVYERGRTGEIEEVDRRGRSGKLAGSVAHEGCTGCR